jgi:hypothetical protein
MNPAPAKGIQSLPTPVIDDVIITEMVNAWKGDYQKLEYGTMWDSVPHGSQQGSFPEHKLVFQQTSSEDGQWVKRIWVNDRVNQDSYNYAIKYSAGSLAHPIYTRTYIVPRDGYGPLPDGTPDTLFPTAVLVDEISERTGNELDSKYITVTRVYETLPGPEVPTKRYNQRGDLETVIVQTVGPNVQPDPDGLLVTGSQVEQVEVGKGVKTTSTVTDHSVLQIKEKKEGLLGETTTTDDIVDPSTEPDALSESVIASVVQQTSKTKAVKRTTSSSGPKTFNNFEKKQGLLGEVDVNESIVAAGTLPDDLSETIISSSVTQIDSAKSKKTTATSLGPKLLSGKRINQRGEIENINESIVPANSSPDEDSVNTISSEVEPIDIAKSKKTTVSVESRITLSGGKSSSGLLGTTSVTDSIVAYPTSPDNLTWTGNGGIIESSIEPISATKAKKTTIQSSGPFDLESKTLIDSQLGLVNATVKKSIVDPNVVPSYSTETGLNIVKDSINKLDNVKSERETIEVEDWPKTTSIDYDEQLGIGITYNETIVSPNEYIFQRPWQDLSNIDYKAIDQWKSLKKQIDINRLTDALENQYYKIPTRVKVKLPDRLTEVTCYIANSYGKGTDFDITQGANTGSYNISNSGSSKSSWSIGGDIYFQAESGYDGYVDGTKHIFFIKNNQASSGSVFEILNNFAQFGTRNPPANNQNTPNAPVYQRWPYIRLKTENIVLITGSRSLSKSNSLSQSVGINGFASSTGEGTSFDVNVNANSINVPPTVHGPIQIKIEEINNVDDVAGIEKPTVSVNPSTLSPTNPPYFSQGLYLFDTEVELYKWGFSKVTATTVFIPQSICSLG